MSKQTRDEAVAELDEAITNSKILLISMGYDSDGVTKKIERVRTALTILAPEPRTEPPTVDEVAGDDYCMGRNPRNGRWDSCTGAWIRHNWLVWYDAWLPESALPMPKGGA